MHKEHLSAPRKRVPQKTSRYPKERISSLADSAGGVRRQKLMAKTNRAYAEGDEVKLQTILRQWESSPESVTGEGIGAELIRVIRKIAQVEDRLRVIEAEIAELKALDLYQLKIKVAEAEGEGRDLLAELALQGKQALLQKWSGRRLAGILEG